jgi:hypothetical protein
VRVLYAPGFWGIVGVGGVIDEKEGQKGKGLVYKETIKSEIFK